MQQVANLRRLGCAGAVWLRRAELCGENIRAKLCVLQFLPATLSGSNFPYTKNRAGAWVWIVATQRSFGRDLILGTQRVLRGARSDFLYTKKRSAATLVRIAAAIYLSYGGDVTKNSDFIEGKMVVLYQFLSGGDVTLRRIRTRCGRWRVWDALA